MHDIYIKKFTEKIAAQWDAYVNNHPDSTFNHLSGWKQVIESSFKHKTYYIYAVKNDSIIGILPLVYMNSFLFGSFLISMPFLNYGGILADSDEIEIKLTQEAISIAQKLGVNFLELRHTDEKNINLNNKYDKIAMLLELPDKHEKLWKGLKAKVRNQVRKGEKSNLTVQFGRLDKLNDFYRVFAENMRDLGTPVYSNKFFKNILTEFEESWICAVYHENQPVAAGFICGFRGKLDIPWASSLRKYNNLNGNMFMYWHILKFACESGFKVFDFGRCTPNKGTHRFKKQWAAQPLQLTWQYWVKNGGDLPGINVENKKYQLLIDTWKKIPLAISNRIGPSIVKNIP